MILSVNRFLLCAALSAATLLAGPLRVVPAHHGGGVEYDMSRTLGPISGTVTRFAFSFPHPQIYFEVVNEDGDVENWAAVLQLTPTLLRERGWSLESVKPGDTLTVTYSPHRTMPRVGFARRLSVNGEFLDEGV